VAAGKKDEQGVLGNLPRSRPGVRSERRRGSAEGATAAAKPRAGTPATKAATAKPKAGSAARAAAGTTATKAATAKPKAASARKAAATKPKAAAAAKPKRAPGAGAKPKARATSRPKPPAAPHGDPVVEREPAPTRDEPRQESNDPLAGAVRIAGKVAETGLKTVGGLLRRLPGR
jgi:hypothetical protein